MTWASRPCRLKPPHGGRNAIPKNKDLPTSTTDTILPYATPRPPRGNFLRAYLLQLPNTALILFILWVLILYLTPKAKEVLCDYRAPFNLLTHTFLYLEYISEEGWLLLTPPLVPLIPIPAALDAYAFPDRQRLVVRTSLAIQATALALFLILYLAAFTLPLLHADW